MASYNYNKLKPGSSDIDREAWPVMYDPQDNSGCLYKVASINSTTIKIDGYGTEQDPLKASVIGGSLDGKVSINITNKEDSAVVLSGLGTSVNPLKADVNPEKLDGRVKIMVSSGSELCWLVGDGTEENPLDVEVNIPADFITNIENTDTIELQVNDSILTANVILNEEQGNVILETSGGLRAEIDLSEYMKTVETRDTDSVVFGGNGWPESPLTASVVSSALDGQVKVEVSDSEGVGLVGDGTENNPVIPVVHYSDFDGKVGIATARTGNVVLEGRGTSGDPLTASVVIPEDYITSTESTESISLAVDEKVLTADLNLSSAADNIARILDDGLYVPETVIPDVPIKTATSTSSLELEVDENGDLTGNVKLSGNQGNVLLTIEEDGLHAEIDLPVDMVEGLNPIFTSADENDKISVGLLRSDRENNILEVIDASGEEGLYVPKSALEDVMTSAGDMILGGVEGAPEVLHKGTEGQVLTTRQDGTVGWTTLPPSPIRDTEDTSTIDLAVDANGVLTAEAIISSAEDNQLVDLDGLYVPEPESLYLGAFPSSDRPTSAQTGQYILDTDLGYVIFRDGDAWVNAAGGIEEGELPSSSGYIDYVQNPMTGTGDLIVGGSDGYPERLAPGTDGQLMSIVNGEPTWIDHNRHSTENYCIVNSNTKFELAGYTKKMYTNIVIPGTSGTYTKLGFFHLSGTVGYVILGMYDASGNLVCQTPMTEPTSATEGNVCWIDTIAPFALEAGEVYQMAFYAIENGYNNLIKTVMIKKKVNPPEEAEVFSNFIAGESLQLTLSELPATKPTVVMSTFVPWMGAKE